MQQVFAYRRLWAKNPPVDILVAWFIGYKPQELPTYAASTSDSPPEPNASGIERGIEKLAAIMGVQLPPAKAF